MIIGLDSAIPPTAAQAQAAKAAGIKLWNGYLSETPQRDGLYRPWTPAEFNVVKSINPHPIAFTSGWDDPLAAKTDAARQGVRLCLDVERMIRDDGPWVQPWLDASGAGLYGVRAVHQGRRAGFHIAAWYVNDPRATYPSGWSGPGLHGWQWWNTHNEFGVGVDRGWYDDGFAQEGETDMTPEEHNILVAMSANIARLYYVFGLEPSPPSPASKSARLDHIEELIQSTSGKAVPGPLGPFDATITPK